VFRKNLTTDLSRIRNSFVIARNTAFTFKSKNIDTKEISKQLGVRYVLEGSVQRDQNRVRVNAQLIDGETGAHLWADRFEEDLADLFKLQDQGGANRQQPARGIGQCRKPLSATAKPRRGRSHHARLGSAVAETNPRDRPDGAGPVRAGGEARSDQRGSLYRPRL
jgi:hypothetical protein